MANLVVFEDDWHFKENIIDAVSGSEHGIA